jgi:hypothetical protein
MPSPFPGMNPYLEQEDAWHDFHERFIPHAADVIGAQIVPNYIAKIDEHVYIHELTADQRMFVGRADVAVARTGASAAALQPRDAAGPAPVYAQIPPAVDVERSSFLELRDRQSRELITVIELLSPSNKRIGPDREQYIAKRRQLLASGVHLVEIDLLRGGTRMPMEDLPQCDYYAMVSRAEERPKVGVWPVRLRDPLPKIPIPLRGDNPPANLDLQAALHHIYDAAGYQYYVYQGRPNPLLHPDDAAWAAQFVPASS